MTPVRIAVFGAGANGGAIAEGLQHAGADVTVYDPWPAHVEAMREHGLRVDRAGEVRVTPMRARHLCRLAEPTESFDLIVLGVKAYDTVWACELLRPHLAPDGSIVAIQNGITLDAVARVFGSDRSVGAVVEVAANMFHPGRIVQEAPLWLALGGETPAAQARAEAIAPVLRAAADVVTTPDIRSAKWMKLVANACELVPSAILDLPLAEAIALPGMYEMMLATGQEALDAALADGRRIVPIFTREADPETLTRDAYVEHLLGVVLDAYTFPSTLTTVLQDWRKGRRAEIDDLNGRVVATAGGKASAPLNSRVLALAQAIERGEAEAGVHNRDLLLSGGAGPVQVRCEVTLK
ncbi:ketopantoate reductase family protein [Leucobacter sp.]